jgi:hypothetical protein
MATHSIQLTRSAQLPHNVGNLQGYRFTVTAHDAVGMPNEVFRMYEQPLDPIAQTRTPVYDGISLPSELVNLPINAPVPPQYHYRVASIDVDYNSTIAGEAAWESIKLDVDLLVKSLAASDLLLVEETVQYTAG